jgi:hypothetical protein
MGTAGEGTAGKFTELEPMCPVFELETETGADSELRAGFCTEGITLLTGAASGIDFAGCSCSKDGDGLGGKAAENDAADVMHVFVAIDRYG